MKSKLNKSLFVFVLLCIISCGGGGGGGAIPEATNSGVSNEVNSVSVSETWVGIWKITSVTGSPSFYYQGQVELIFTRNGDILTGEAIVANDNCDLSGEIKGVIERDELNIEITSGSTNLLIRGSITENKVIADFEILSGACASYEGTLSLLLMSNATSPEVISPSAVGSGDWTNYVLPYGLLSANTSSVTSPFITDGDRNTGVVLYGKESQGRNGPRLNAPFVRFDFNVGFDAEALVFNITSSSANGVFQGSLIFNMYSQNNLFQDIRLAHMVDGIDTFSFVFSKCRVPAQIPR